MSYSSYSISEFRCTQTFDAMLTACRRSSRRMHHAPLGDILENGGSALSVSVRRNSRSKRNTGHQVRTAPHRASSPPPSSPPHVPSPLTFLLLVHFSRSVSIGEGRKKKPVVSSLLMRERGSEGTRKRGVGTPHLVREKWLHEKPTRWGTSKGECGVRFALKFEGFYNC